VFPRACLGPSDAIFAAKFVMLAHRFAAPGFSTLYVYQHVSLATPRRRTLIRSYSIGVCRPAYTPGLSLRREITVGIGAAFVISLISGRCLGAMLEVFHNWHADEKLYNKEAIGTSADGFVRPGLDTRNKNSDGIVGLNSMNWRQFRNMYARLQDCLSQVSYTDRRVPKP